MSTRCLMLLVLLLSSVAVHAAPASTESIEELLRVMRSESLISSVQAQLQPAMRQAMQQAAQQQSHGQPLSAEQQQAMNTLAQRLTELFNAEFSWSKLKPEFVQIYRESFDQTEVNDMLAFYKTPSGQSLLNKMPIVMQKSMQISQQALQNYLPKMQQIIRESTEEMQPVEK